MSGVEFLSDESAPDERLDEDLDTAPHGRKPWWILGLAAVALAAVVWVATRPSQSEPSKQQAAPSDRPIATPSSSDAVAVACNNSPNCVASDTIPAEIRSALRIYLPQEITSLQVRSYLAQGLNTGSAFLTDRKINVVGGSVELLITVHRTVGPAPAPSEIVTAPPGTGSALVQRQTAVYTIDLQYLAPETVPPSIASLGVLAVDPRLEAL